MGFWGFGVLALPSLKTFPCLTRASCRKYTVRGCTALFTRLMISSRDCGSSPSTRRMVLSVDNTARGAYGFFFPFVLSKNSSYAIPSGISDTVYHSPSINWRVYLMPFLTFAFGFIPCSKSHPTPAVKGQSRMPSNQTLKCVSKQP